MTSKEQIKQYRLLTDWYLSVLEGIKAEEGSKVLSEHNNSLEWIAGHLLVTRCRNIVRLGQIIEPYTNMDAFVDQTLPPPSFIPFDRNKKYPSLEECAEEWTKYSRLFMSTLESVDETALKKTIPLSGPTGGNTMEDLLVSIILHEAFHIGQMSIIRKALGYKAMYWFYRGENGVENDLI